MRRVVSTTIGRGRFDFRSPCCYSRVMRKNCTKNASIYSETSGIYNSHLLIFIAITVREQCRTNTVRLFKRCAFVLREFRTRKTYTRYRRTTFRQIPVLSCASFMIIVMIIFDRVFSRKCIIVFELTWKRVRAK